MSEQFVTALRDLMKQQGFNARSLSLAAGLNATAVRDILTGRSKAPLFSTVKKLADALGCEVARLMPDQQELDHSIVAEEGNKALRQRTLDIALAEIERAFGKGSVAKLGENKPKVVSDRGRILVGERDLKVYASAEGGPDGAMVIDNSHVETVKRPEPLLNVSGGFGIYVVGDSMEPAYSQGDIALIHPTMPPQRHKNVLLVREDGNGTQFALIKRLTGWDDTHWHLKQFNPELEFKLPKELWRAVYRVVGKYDAR